MLRAGVPDEEIAVFNRMTGAAVGGTLVDTMDKVDTAADSVAFDNSVAHFGLFDGVVCEIE